MVLTWFCIASGKIVNQRSLPSTFVLKIVYLKEQKKDFAHICKYNILFKIISNSLIQLAPKICISQEADVTGAKALSETLLK